MLMNNTYKNRVSNLISWGHWFAFYNMLIALLLACIYIFNSTWPPTFFGFAYLFTSWIGHFTFLIFAFYILILFPITFLLPQQRLLRLFGSLYATLFISTIFLDSQIYQHMHLHLNAMVWKLLVSGEEESALSIWKALALFIPICFCVELSISAHIWHKLRKITQGHHGRKYVLFFGICFISSHLLYLVADAQLYHPITMQRTNYPLSYPMTAKTFMEKHGWLDRVAYAKQEALKDGNALVVYPLEPLQFSDSGKKYNLLVIMIDSLRSDMLNQDVMPHLTQFAQENLNYQHHYSTSNDNIGGLFGFFYGLPPTYINNFRIDGKKPQLLSTLKQRGYRFNLLSSDNFDTRFYAESIFDTDKLPKQSSLIFPEEGDEKTIHQLSHWLQTPQKSPWFTYLELKSVSDYELGDYPQVFPTDEAPTNVSAANKALKENYKNASHFVDEKLNQIFTQLKKQALLDNTIVIITANHGVEFNETKTNSWGSNTNYSHYQIQVPLVMHWPHRKPQEIETRSSHLDIVPTLMESLLDTTTPSTSYASGINLFDLHGRPWLLAGDTSDIAIIEPKETIVLDKFGNYSRYNENYKEIKNEKAKISVLFQVMKELKRFNAVEFK